MTLLKEVSKTIKLKIFVSNIDWGQDIASF